MQTINAKTAQHSLRWGVLLLGLIAIPSVFAQQKVDETLDTGSKPTVEMEHIYGKAMIKTWDKDQVRVTGTLGELTEEFTFEKNGNTVVIEVEVKNNHYRWEDKDSSKDDLTVYVPVGSKFDYETVNADVTIEGVKGGTSIEVVNGDITGTDLSSRVRIESVNGDIELEGIYGELQVESVNGNISVEHLDEAALELISVNGKINVESQSKDVSIETINGNSAITLAMVEELRMSSVNGNSKVSLALADGGDVELDTVGGSVTLSFTDSVSARFEIEAHAGGNIVNRINDTAVNKAKYGPGKWVDFTEGNGAGKVRVSTVNGKIVVEN